MSERKNIVIPAWYSTYLALRRAGVNPYSEIASMAALADIFASNELFLTPCDCGAEFFGLYNSSLLGPLELLDPKFLENSNATSTQLPFTPLHIETNMHTPIMQQYFTPDAAFGDFTKISACQLSPRRPSQPLRPPRPPPPSRMYQENNAIPTEEERNETRRIASRIHILHSQKLSPDQNLSDDDVKALLQLQLSLKQPLLPPWYRHAPR